MTGDRYPEYYAAKLWQMIPAVYRTLDSDPSAPGPLQEMVKRVAAQAAVVRRSIDRLWEDQSIETCDDWIIPYIGDLVATQLVACLDPAGQRRDVAKTIYYRRRKGTVGLLEELASDIASRNARVVEFFRRLSRTRHNFDPPIARRATDITAIELEGLIGAATSTPIGGYADLRNMYGVSRTGTAFDEYFYTADFRRGRQTVGWHNIPKTGVFLWWLKTFPVPASTPVQYQQCPNPVFTFDPTGREVPLFSPMRRVSGTFGEHWVSPNEWELPGPIDQALFEREHVNLYPDPVDPPRLFALSVDDGGGAVPLSAVTVAPAHGRFYLPGGAAGMLTVTYNYGFGSDIGAGPYNQRGDAPLPEQPSEVRSASGGGAIPPADINAIASQGTLLFTDSLTYALPGDLGGVSGIANVLIQGDNGQRPVIRATGAARAQWTIKGAAGAKLVLQGVHLIGADLVLTGEFESVEIRCATLDPGNSGADLTPPAAFATAADDQTLWPTRLFVEAKINTLTLAQAITGPIHTRSSSGSSNSGSIDILTITDSIVQALPETVGGPVPAAILSDSGETHLSRVTVLGGIEAHRLNASECVIDDIATAEDAQHGCIRFSAYAEGSAVHQPYESVTVAPQAELFRSRDFGQPHYAQLRDTADTAITGGHVGASIVAGAEDGSEMGAFCREKIPLKRRGLTQKFAEFMPIGQVPVWIDVT